MKRKLLVILTAVLLPLSVLGQSSMTDDQVMNFIVKEYKAGSSRGQIVTKLIQNGVDISQIRRVQKKYERIAQDKGLGAVSDASIGKTNDDRTRTNNVQKETAEGSSQRISNNGYNPQLYTFDENDKEFTEMQGAMDDLLPTDTATMYKRLLEQQKRNKKKVWGRDIFNNKNLSFAPAMNIATPRDYVLGPGDAVFIDVYGASQKTVQGVVSPEGTVTIEGFGPVQVGGLTVSQANAQLRSTLGARYSSSRIRLSVGQTRSVTVNVYGEVNVPGTYTLSAFSTPLNALYMAGGINDVGTLRNIKVYRNGRMIAAIDVYDHILNGKSVNIHLADNDVIYVGTYDCLVNITGKVKRPMYYEMKKNESVATLLKYAGGFTGDAYTKSVRLIRKTGRQYSIHNIEEFDLSSFHVSDEDSVSVDSIIARFENSVEVKGAVFRPGMYEVGNDINSVRTLIEHAEGVREEAFTDHAVMHRMRADRTLEVIPVDVQGILDGRVVDIPLQANDVLFIPTKQEMMQERTLTIHGEVHYPGIYKYAANETVEDLILQAGGLKETASTVKVDIARRINNPEATSPDSIISQTFTLALKDGFVIDGEPGFVLMPYDEIYVRQSPGFNIQKNVRVEGNVMFAGVYTLSSKNERISDIIKKAGGLNDLAYIRGARLERRTNEDERLRMQTVLRMLQAQAGQKDTLNIALLELGDTYPVGVDFEKALKNPGCDEDIVLREGDRIFVPEYNGTVKISGDVMYPNTVTYEKGKRPSYYIDQAGGWGNRAKKSNTYIIYMNGKVAKVGHNAKVQPGCEIIVPSKPKNSGRSLTEWLTIGSSVSSIAAMIATIANIVK